MTKIGTRRSTGVLVLVLLLVNGAAVWGQAGWALENIVPAGWDLNAALALSLAFAAAIELIGVFLAMMADAGEDEGLPSGGVRLGSYAVGLVSGSLNFSHWYVSGVSAAIAFGFLSAVSPFLWGIWSRVRRGQMSAPSRRFWHPVRSVSLIRGMAWDGLSDENEAVRRLSKPRLLDVPRVPSDTDMDNFLSAWDMSRDMMTDTVSHADMSEGQRQDMADRLRTAMDNLSPEIGTGVSQPVPPSGFGDIDWDSELSELSGQDAALTALGQDVSRTAEALSNGTDTVLPQRTRLSGGSVPAGFLDTLRTWNPDIMSPADFKRTAAGTHGVSVKTVGRWMDREMSQDDPRRRR